MNIVDYKNDLRVLVYIAQLDVDKLAQRVCDKAGGGLRPYPSSPALNKNTFLVTKLQRGSNICVRSGATAFESYYKTAEQNLVRLVNEFKKTKKNGLAYTMIQVAWVYDKDDVYNVWGDYGHHTVRFLAWKRKSMRS